MSNDSKRWTHEKLVEQLRLLVDTEAKFLQQSRVGSALHKMYELWASALGELCQERECTNKARRKG